MFSIRAMLRVAEKGVSVVTEDDLSGCLGGLMDKPDAELLGLIKSNVNTAAAAAALVFMHSAYENAVFDLIKRLVQYDPGPWAALIEKKKWLKKTERESFPWKVEKILAVLQPSTTKDVVPGFEFQLETLKAIDDLRHDLTHRTTFATPIPDIYEKLTYLHKTVLLLEKLAEAKYPGPSAKS